MSDKPLEEYIDKELDEMINMNETKLRQYKQLLHHTPETIRSSQQTENRQRELIAERVRRLELKKTKTAKT